MRIQDYFTYVPTEGEIILKSKSFKGWRVKITLDLDVEYTKDGEPFDEFEESDADYRLLMAMRQCDTWERVNANK